LRKYSVLIVGVGGQGIMTIGNILKKAGQKKGWIVVGTETRGASQREGAVDSSVRYVILNHGEERNDRSSVVSPLIPMAGADMIIALETNEALRNARFASEKTSVLLNLYEILPPDAVANKRKGATSDEVFNTMKTFSSDVRAIRANELSKKEFGDFSMSNMIMLGAAQGIGKMPLSDEDLREVVEEEFGGNTSNALKGLEIGMNEIRRTEFAT
jgi:indolepyruvate ferredoxin oxidoreductase beta subunit